MISGDSRPTSPLDKCRYLFSVRFSADAMAWNSRLLTNPRPAGHFWREKRRRERSPLLSVADLDVYRGDLLHLREPLSCKSHTCLVRKMLEFSRLFLPRMP